MEEIWKPAKNYEGYYEISNFGRVKSIDRFVKQGNSIRHCKEKIKNIFINPNGYPAVTLCKNKKSKAVPIHILIANAFIPNPENKPFIDHINTNKNDYRIENLRWVTAKENANNTLTLEHCKLNTYSKEALFKRLVTKKQKQTNGCPKTVYQYSKSGELINEYFSFKEAFRQTGIHDTAIRRCLNDNTLSAGGYMWFDSKQENISFNKRKSVNRKSICQLDLNGNIIKEWSSVTEASKDTGIYPSNITRSIKCKTHKKHLFCYKEDIK